MRSDVDGEIDCCIGQARRAPPVKSTTASPVCLPGGSGVLGVMLGRLASLACRASSRMLAHDTASAPVSACRYHFLSGVIIRSSRCSRRLPSSLPQRPTVSQLLLQGFSMLCAAACPSITCTRSTRPPATHASGRALSALRFRARPQTRPYETGSTPACSGPQSAGTTSPANNAGVASACCCLNRVGGVCTTQFEGHACQCPRGLRLRR